MDYQIIELEDFSVIGVRYELSKSLSNNLKLAQNFWKEFNNKLKINKLYLGSNWCKYAFIERIEDKVFYYISIPKKDVIPNGFTEKDIYKSKYLKVKHVGNMNKLDNTIKYIYNEIIPKNNIKVQNKEFIYFEKYDYKFHWNRVDSIIEIYIPIEK